MVRKRGRVVEVDVAVFEVGGRLAVGDHDHLLVGLLWRPSSWRGKHQRVVQVRAVLVLAPVELGQHFGLQLAGYARKADDVEVVLRELGADQVVEREGDFLGGQEAAAQQHRAAHIYQQDCGALRHELGGMHLEVGRLQLYGSACALRAQEHCRGWRCRSKSNGSPNS